MSDNSLIMIYICIYTLWSFNIAMENYHFLICASSINGPFSTAIYIYIYLGYRGIMNVDY